MDVKQYGSIKVMHQNNLIKVANVNLIHDLWGNLFLRFADGRSFRGDIFFFFVCVCVCVPSSLIVYNERTKFSRQFIFAKISVSRISQKLIAREIDL